MKTIRVTGDIREAFSVTLQVDDNVDAESIDTSDPAFQERAAQGIGRRLRLGHRPVN